MQNKQLKSYWGLVTFRTHCISQLFSGKMTMVNIFSRWRRSWMWSVVSAKFPGNVSVFPMQSTCFSQTSYTVHQKISLMPHWLIVPTFNFQFPLSRCYMPLHIGKCHIIVTYNSLWRVVCGVLTDFQFLLTYEASCLCFLVCFFPSCGNRLYWLYVKKFWIRGKEIWNTATAVITEFPLFTRCCRIPLNSL